MPCGTQEIVIMFFSVIVPVYKVEKYLPDCINSILGQTFGDFEIILVDDGSPDLCGDICDNYAKTDDRIKVIHKENGGLASARRTGIKLASGDYVFNLDSDDLIEKDTLECAHKIITETNAEIVSFAYRWVKNSKTVSVTDDGIDEGLYLKKDIEKRVKELVAASVNTLFKTLWQRRNFYEDEIKK